MRLKWYGTAGILIEHDGTRTLFDPFLSLNDREYRPSLDELSSVMHIFATHGHLDHIAGIPAIWKYGGGNANIYCTETPRRVLITKGVNSEKIQEIKPGDVIHIGVFEISVLKGKHIEFDWKLILKTLLNPRMIWYWKNLLYMLKENIVFKEAGETVVYDIRAADKRILLLGSLNLDANTTYPQGADIFVLPFQGRSDMNSYAMRFVAQLNPKSILLDHHNDSFPPVSSTVEAQSFISQMKDKHPGIPVICLPASSEWIVV